MSKQSYLESQLAKLDLNAGPVSVKFTDFTGTSTKTLHLDEELLRALLQAMYHPSAFAALQYAKDNCGYIVPVLNLPPYSPVEGKSVRVESDIWNDQGEKCQEKLVCIITNCGNLGYSVEYEIS